MNKDNHFKKKILEPTIKEVKKYRKKHQKLPDESAYNDLKIQIIMPFIRIVSFTIGLFLLIICFFAFVDRSLFLGGVSSLIGLVLVIFGLIGKKKKLGEVVEKSDYVSDISLVIEAILNIDW